MVATCTGIGVAATRPMDVATAPYEDLHFSRNTNHMFALEADHKLDSPYPRAQLSDRMCHIRLLAS